MSFPTSTKRYGKHKGIVSNNNDPQKLGRLKLIVPSVYGKQGNGEFMESPWALPAIPFAGEDEGMLFLPNVHSGVWVEFEEGDISRPIWVGCFWSRPSAVTKVSTRTGSEVPQRSNYPKNRVIQTKRHRIELNDATDELVITHQTGALIRFMPNGTVEVNTPEAVNVTAGGAITVNGASTAINAGEELAFKSALEKLDKKVEDVAVALNLHFHTSAAPGSPTSPPSGPAVIPTTPPLTLPLVLPPIAPTGTLKTVAG